jgi:hypothetical protein
MPVIPPLAPDLQRRGADVAFEHELVEENADGLRCRREPPIAGPQEHPWLKERRCEEVDVDQAEPATKFVRRASFACW